LLETKIVDPKVLNEKLLKIELPNTTVLSISMAYTRV
jgi:U4/U6 small nuclear ribonucleoprotein PRP31